MKYFFYLLRILHLGLGEVLQSRFSSKGKLFLQLKEIKQLVFEHPESNYASQIYKAFVKKFWFGARKVTYYKLYEEAWQKFESNIIDEVFEIADLRVQYEDGGIKFDFTGIFFADKNQDFLYSSLNGDQLIAARLLSIINTSEGAYTSQSVILNKGDVVIDAGANMGIFSLYAARLSARQVYAFEPQIEALEILEKNISMNNYNSCITIVPFGISDSMGDLKLSHSEDHHAAASIVIDRNDSNNFEIIHCVTLDKWVEENKIERIDFIKADIEGAERLLLKGAKNVLRSMSPKLAICTYHLPDDKEVLTNLILEANPNYTITYTSHKLFAHVPKMVR